MEKPKPNPPTHFRPPDTPFEPMEFLSRSWSPSALELSKLLTPSQYILSQDLCASVTACCVQQNVTAESEDATNSSSNSSCGSSNHAVSGNPFCLANDETCLSVVERIMSQSQEVSPRTSGRLSHSSGPLNGSLTDSPPVSPSELDDPKHCHSNPPHNGQFRAPANPGGGIAPSVAGVGGKTMGRWLKDKREKKKEEARVRNTQLHAAISVAGVAAAVAAMAAATAASSASGKEEQTAKSNMAIASAATLVAAQCVEAAEAMGADREQLASVVNSAVNVRSAGDIMTLTAAAATALRGAATLKARALKDVWNVAPVIPVDRGIGMGGGNGNNNSFSGELMPEENFLGVCSKELLARGCELLKRTRKGDLHWKIVSVYIDKSNQVMLKMKSRHVAGTITKKKKSVVLEVIKNVSAWPGRHLLEGGEHRRYFGLKTVLRGVIEFECLNQREHDIWTHGVSRLLSIVEERSTRHRV